MAWPAKVPTTSNASAGQAARRINPMLLGLPLIALEESERRHEGKFFHAFDSQKLFRESGGLVSSQRIQAGITRRVTQFFLYTQQLVVLCRPVGSRQAAGLDLAAVQGDRQVGDCRILGFAG